MRERKREEGGDGVGKGMGDGGGELGGDGVPGDAGAPEDRRLKSRRYTTKL